MDELIRLLKGLTPDLTPGYLRAFHDELQHALTDGKLTEEEIERLEQRKEELGITDDALALARADLYAAAFERVKADDAVTEEEWEEMEHIQDYLGASDREVARTKKQLYRMRILTEIKGGSLPVVRTEEVIPEKEELIHWTEPVEVYEPTGATIGGGVYPVEKLRRLDKGLFVITSKRLIVKGGKSVTTMRLRSVVDADAHVNGVFLAAANRRPVFLRYTEKGNQSVVGSILLAVIEQAKARG